MMNRSNKEVVRSLSSAEWDLVSGGNGASDDVKEEQIETVVVSGGSPFLGGGGGLIVGSSISSGGGNSFYGPTLGVGGGFAVGYAASSANASQAADNINEGFELCLPLCVDLKVQGLFTNDFKITVGARAGLFYGSTELL